MNAPAPLSGGDARTQLAEVLDERLPDSMGRAECNALLDALLPVVERIADERAAEALDQAMRENRTTVAKLSPVERLTCFLVKGEDLLARAASLRAASRGETGQ